MRRTIYYFLLIIQIVSGDDKNTENKILAEFGCNPPRDWKLIKDGSSDGHVKDVCLSKSYQIHEPPIFDKPTPVAVLFKNKQIGEINERNQFIKLHIDIMSFWEDTRVKAKLANQLKTIPPRTKTSQSIWTPLSRLEIKDLKEITSINDPVLSDLTLITGTIANTILSREIFQPNATVVKADTKFTIKFFCEFDFSKYPFDIQTCNLEIFSLYVAVTVYHETSYGWKSRKQHEFGAYDINHDMYNKNLNRSSIPRSIFGIRYTLMRQIEPYIYQYYLPSNVIVMTSFFSFIIPLSAIPGRVALVVTQMLTLMSIFIHQMDESPSEAKLNPLGKYILVALLFVFGAMVEFAFVLIIKQKLDCCNDCNGLEENQKEMQTPTKSRSARNGKRVRNVWLANCDFNSTQAINEKHENQYSCKLTFSENIPVTSKIDYAAFICFIVSYLLFNVIYFSI